MKSLMESIIQEDEKSCLEHIEKLVIAKRLKMKKPKIVCLCGSTRFKDQYEKTMRELTLQGIIVLSVGLFGHLEGLDMNGETKKMLDELHLRKIDLSDEIFVINVDGYIGESTRREIEYAKKTGKKINYLQEI